MGTSVREVTRFMDPVRPAATIAGLATMHRWQGGRHPGRLSLRRILNRHTDPRTARVPFLFYNTWFMPGIDLLGLRIGAAPATDERAGEIGLALRHEAHASGGLVAALCEVWVERERTKLLEAWPRGQQPATALGSGPKKLLDPLPLPLGLSDGLLTLSVGKRINRTDYHTFVERGNLSDADFHSNKGVLLAEIDLGLGSNLEVYSTHLFNGGIEGLPDHERIGTQLAQVDELIAFVRDRHRPENVILVAGDFNIPAHTSGYRQLEQRLRGALDLDDVWAIRNGTPGHTSGFNRRPGICPPFDASNCGPGSYCEDPDDPPDRTDRIDYVLLERPKPEHRIVVDFTRPRRRPFCRPPNAPRRSEVASMSDHIGIQMTLVVSPA